MKTDSSADPNLHKLGKLIAYYKEPPKDRPKTSLLIRMGWLTSGGFFLYVIWFIARSVRTMLDK